MYIINYGSGQNYLQVLENGNGVAFCMLYVLAMQKADGMDVYDTNRMKKMYTSQIKTKQKAVVVVNYKTYNCVCLIIVKCKEAENVKLQTIKM